MDNQYAKFMEEFREKEALGEFPDTYISIVMHLMNKHRIDKNSALDHSSHAGADHGIDAWHFSPDNELFIYQSKFSSAKDIVLEGIGSLHQAREWLEKALSMEKLDAIPKNNCIYTLLQQVIGPKKQIRKINFILVSLIDSGKIENSEEYKAFRQELVESKINKIIDEVNLTAEEYNIQPTSLPKSSTKYPITKLKETTIALKNGASLHLAYIPLYDLVDLYKQRGNILFEKNVRLSITAVKASKDRLVHPMEETLDDICKSETLDPNIFPFYHVGITVSATTSTQTTNENIVNLVDPNIVNGCQTISIASKYFEKLESSEIIKQINNFKKIKVMAKIIVGASDDQLKEITNANNRQNPIENWQLFSNDQIHIQIESSLRNHGIFYERQAGKYSSIMNNSEVIAIYDKSGTGAHIKVEELAKLICLGKKKLQWVAKPSDVFTKKKNHDEVFVNEIPKFYKDIILTSNISKAIKRSITKVAKNNYMYKAFSNEQYVMANLLNRPIINAYLQYLGLAYFYQNKSFMNLREEYAGMLWKAARPNLDELFEKFYPKIIIKLVEWYTNEYKSPALEIGSEKLEEFINKLSIEENIDLKNGRMPFTDKSNFS